MQNKTQHNARLATLASSVALTAALIVAGCGGSGGGGPAMPTPTPSGTPTGTPTATPNGTPTATPTNAPLTGKIVFVSGRGGGGIFTMTPDGSNVTRVARGGTNPVWSPDRKKIALGSDDIYVMNADGTNLVKLTNDPDYDYSPTWSPDGKIIAFVSVHDGDSEIYAVKSDGTGRRRLTNRPDIDDFRPAWSPDGTKIAFESGADPNSPRLVRGTGGLVVPSVINLMNANGTNIRRLTQGFSFEPAWHPRGDKIVFRGAPGLFTIDVNGTNLKQLTAEAYSDPVYSPDGSKIACVGSGSGSSNTDIFALNADGTNPVNITNNPARDEAPDWR